MKSQEERCDRKGQARFEAEGSGVIQTFTLRELKQDGLRHLYQRTHESLLGTAKLSPLGELLLEISAIRSLESHLKIGKGTPGMRFRLMAMRILVDLLKAMEKGGKEFLDALMESIRNPYKSTMGSLGGQIAKV